MVTEEKHLKDKVWDFFLKCLYGFLDTFLKQILIFLKELRGKKVTQCPECLSATG